MVSYNAGDFVSTNKSNYRVFEEPEESGSNRGSTSSESSESTPLIRRQNNKLNDLESSSSPFVNLLTVLVSLTGFMFGYDTGYISSALVTIGKGLGKNLIHTDKELITSVSSLGALLAALVAGILADLIGRKRMILVSNVLFIIGVTLQITAHEVTTMVQGRFIAGLAIGLGSLIAPLYVSELAPTKYRGRLVVINVMGLTIGQLIAYAVGAGIGDVHNGWRIMGGLALIPSVIQLIMFMFMPDTPRYLIMKNRLEELSEVLQRIYKDADLSAIDAKVQELDLANDEIDGSQVLSKTWNSIKEIHRVPSNLRALIIGCGLQGIQQFTGWNALIYFSATIFESIGFTNPRLVSTCIAGTNCLCTTFAFFVIDRIGRRKILLLGLPLMMCALTGCGILFYFLGIDFTRESLAAYSSTGGGVSFWGVAVIVSFTLYASGFSVGIGNVPWQQSELFPQNVRGVGASYATATNWAGSLIMSSTFLSMMDRLTATGTFLLFAVLTFFSILFVYFLYPELTGLDLEEVQCVLAGGFNVEMSLEMSKARTQGHDDEEQMSEVGYGSGRLVPLQSREIEDYKPSTEFVL